MIVVSFILIVLLLFIFVLRITTYSYYFQIKEYRFDRLFSSMREQGILHFLYLQPFHLPAKKLRNVVTIGFLTIIALPVLCLSYQLPVMYLLILGILMPIISFVSVSCMVWGINIPVYMYRQYKIRRAQTKLQQHEVTVVGITGSYGKTSIKEYLAHLLETQYKTVKTLKNMNTDIGVAICILQMVKKTTEYLIAEIGAYRRGEAAAIAAFIQPSAVIVSAFGNQHIDLYGSKEVLVESESEPLQYLRADGTAYINADIPEFKKITKGAEYRIVTYSVERTDTDIYANAIKTSSSGTSAHIHYRGHWFPIETQLLGRHTIQNLLPAIAYASDQGILHPTIQKAVANLRPIEHKLSLHTGLNKSTILSDSLNSNVDGFIEAVRIASEFPHKEKIIISKGIIELGNDKHDSYRRIAKEIKATNLTLWTTDRLFPELIGPKQAQLFLDEEEIRSQLKQRIGEGSLVVLEGKFTKDFVAFVLSL
ncbi:MAG: Mur ligase family protein [Patescibacteria group bacterium]